MEELLGTNQLVVDTLYHIFSFTSINHTIPSVFLHWLVAQHNDLNISLTQIWTITLHFLLTPNFIYFEISDHLGQEMRQLCTAHPRLPCLSFFGFTTSSDAFFLFSHTLKISYIQIRLNRNSTTSTFKTRYTKFYTNS